MAEQARLEAAAEGLELEPAANQTGFKYVYAICGRYRALIHIQRGPGGNRSKQCSLGRFATAEEAAVAVARYRSFPHRVLLSTLPRRRDPAEHGVLRDKHGHRICQHGRRCCNCKLCKGAALPSAHAQRRSAHAHAPAPAPIISSKFLPSRSCAVHVHAARVAE